MATAVVEAVMVESGRGLQVVIFCLALLILPLAGDRIRGNRAPADRSTERVRGPINPLA